MLTLFRCLIAESAGASVQQGGSGFGVAGTASVELTGLATAYHIPLPVWLFAVGCDFFTLALRSNVLSAKDSYYCAAPTQTAIVCCYVAEWLLACCVDSVDSGGQEPVCDCATLSGWKYEGLVPGWMQFKNSDWRENHTNESLSNCMLYCTSDTSGTAGTPP